MPLLDDDNSGSGMMQEVFKRELREFNHSYLTRKSFTCVCEKRCILGCFGYFEEHDGYRIVLELMQCSLQKVIGETSSQISF